MSVRHPVLLLMLPLMIGVLAPTTSRAQCDVVAQCIPQPTCPYISATEVSFRESPSKASNGTPRNPSHCEAPPAGGAPVESFFDIEYGWTIRESPTLPPRHRKGSTTGTIRMMPPLPDGTIPLEMLALELSSAVDSVRLRESPTKPSTGLQRATPNPGGGSHIDSFFDVFFELSVDGGATWSEAEQPANFQLTQEQPTPARIATWGTMKALYR